MNRILFLIVLLVTFAPVHANEQGEDYRLGGGDLSLGLNAVYLGSWNLGVNVVHFLGKAAPTLDAPTGPVAVPDPATGPDDAATAPTDASASRRRAPRRPPAPARPRSPRRPPRPAPG